MAQRLATDEPIHHDRSQPSESIKLDEKVVHMFTSSDEKLSAGDVRGTAHFETQLLGVASFGDGNFLPQVDHLNEVVKIQDSLSSLTREGR